MRPRYTLALAALLAAIAFAPPSRAQDPTSEARAHLQQHASRYGLSAADLTELAVTDSYASRRSGLTHVYLRQAIGGLPVVGAEFAVAVGSDGRITHAAGRGAALDGRRLGASPTVSAEAAATVLARAAGLSVSEPFRVAAASGGRAPSYVLTDGGVAEEPVEANLVYRLNDEGAVSLSWEVGLYERGAQHYWLGYVDAVSGAVIEQRDLVVHDVFGVSLPAAPAVSDLAPLASSGETGAMAPVALTGSYKVYALPDESPLHAAPLPPAEGRILATNPSDAQASPFGWHDTNGAAGPEFTITRGNNVHAYTDRRSNGSGPSPDGGPALAFDFPIDHTQNPVTYGAAAVTNLFYTNNVFHDILWQYGFDEPAGNFQVNNYGRGGAGNDDVRAEAQDGADRCRPIPIPIFCLNNANFFTPADGQRPRMQMFEWTETTPRRDGDLDNGIILHEYGHGVSNRLTGGPSNVGCLGNSEQMGEGWSDYFAAVLTIKPIDTRTTNRGIGNYPLGLSASGPGIRTYPYNTDFSVNPHTYQDTRNAVVPHGVGEIWAMALWEATWDLIDAHGFDPDVYDANGTAGNQIMLQLVIEGLKLQPCSPGFVDGRDAILAADQALYGGAHLSTLWGAFARRGLGVNASQGSTGTNADNTEDFSVPAGAVTLSLVPSNPPVVVARGGTISFTATIAVAAGGPSTVEYWSEATLPGGQVRRVLGPITATVTPGTQVSIPLSQVVPNNAPTGAYTYTMKVGDYPGFVAASDAFPATVTASEVATGREADASEAWLAYDADGTLLAPGAEVDLRTTTEPGAPPTAALAAELPAVPALHAAYPNPVAGAGARATLPYDVAEPGRVRLAVYDLLGREVAVLADGAHEAGRFTAALDGSSLPAGVYLVRMTAGRFAHTQRVSLLR